MLQRVIFEPWTNPNVYARTATLNAQKSGSGKVQLISNEKRACNILEIALSWRTTRKYGSHSGDELSLKLPLVFLLFFWWPACQWSPQGQR